MSSFDFNPFQFIANEVQGTLFPFAPAITNYFLNDVISLNSPVMGECSLFLKNNNINFYQN
jgi:hypothetical protein